MRYRYKDHVDASFGSSDETLKEVINLTFDQWLAFYNGDPENWSRIENSNFQYGNRRAYFLPMYRKITYLETSDNRRCKEEKRIYIKFVSSLDYLKYIRYWDDLQERGEDYENQQEILALAEHIGKIAAERLRETQERTQKAIDDNQRLMEATRLRFQRGIE